MSRVPAGVWIFLPQASSRLVSIYIFAAAAQRCTTSELGALAVGGAITSAATALAPAVVGKPLASLSDPAERRERGPMAQSAAIAWIGALAVLLALAVPLTGGLTRLALLGGAMGLAGAIVVESTYWREVFLDGARPAGIRLSAAYLGQAVLVTLAALWLPNHLVVLSPFAALLVVAPVVLVRQRGLSRAGALRWSTGFRSSWVPYVLGVLSTVALVQLTPPVLTATAGFEAVSVYRAGELAFGLTNLLIGVASGTLLTQGAARPRRAYARASVAFGSIAALNGVVLAVVPESLIRLVLGPVTHPMLGVLPVLTVQRVGLAVSSVGAALIIPLVSARRYGLLGALTAAVALAGLVVGGLSGGLEGALTGLACAELSFALLYGLLLRRST